MTSTKDEAKDKLRKIKDKLDKRSSKYEGLGEKFDEDDNFLLGPTNDIQRAQTKKDIRESNENE